MEQSDPKLIASAAASNEKRDSAGGSSPPSVTPGMASSHSAEAVSSPDAGSQSALNPAPADSSTSTIQPSTVAPATENTMATSFEEQGVAAPAPAAAPAPGAAAASQQHVEGPPMGQASHADAAAVEANIHHQDHTPTQDHPTETQGVSSQMPPAPAPASASTQTAKSPRSSMGPDRKVSSCSLVSRGDSSAVGPSSIDNAHLTPGNVSNGTATASHEGTPRPRPEPTLTSKSSFSETDLKRTSVSSMYSLASARGVVPSSAASATGSDAGTPSRSVSGVLGAGKATADSPQQHPQNEGQHGQSSATHSASAGHLAPSNPHDMVRRNPAPHRSGQPTRSRSRVKRRLSGSTAASSHSPASDRVQHHKDKEEAKPAPWGVIGICALDVKARSKPSRNILNRLIANREFDVVVFGDKVILDEDIENWPMCDYLISFYSDGFPLDKAIAYVKARKPFCVNDLPMQKILWDRRACLHILDRAGVLSPKRLEVNRDGGPNMLAEVAKHAKELTGLEFDPQDPRFVSPPRKVELLDNGDILSVDGALLKKPFVEKPVSGEDHNIIIYFPQSSGGGGRRLFRKIGNKSSEYEPDLNIPRAILEPNSSYLYEKFMLVENAEDVKAYTVGPNYCHAETRKSPVVDGVVRRNTHGKEIRYVTSLCPEEKEIASKISTSFGQRVCGFDLLRADGKSYVIDVNGWSFVKDNEDYYDHCAKILKDLFVKERLRRGGVTTGTLPSPSAVEFPDPVASSVKAKDKDSGQQASPNNGSGPGVASPPASKPASQAPVSQGLPDKSSSDLQKDAAGLSRSNTGLKPPTEPSAGSGTHSLASSPSLPPPPPLVESTPAVTPTAGQSASPSAAASLKGESLAEAEEPPAPPPPKHSWKLKGIVSVIRHADRTPKQKYKFTFHTEPFIELLKGHQEEVLLIGEVALASVIQAVDVAVTQGIEDPAKLKSLRNVLVKKGSWAGTKVQIKPMFRKKKTDLPVAPEEAARVLRENAAAEQAINEQSQDEGEQSNPEKGGRKAPKRQDSLSGVTMSRITAAEEQLVLDKLQLIVKWGGEPTHSARYQAQELGENMRNDLMLLNREVLDEVHVYSSSERRVTTSAQIWASSFLGQKDLPEDFIRVRKDLLDDSNAAKDEMDKVKKKLKGLLRKGNERPPQFAWPDKMPEPSEVQTRVVQLMKFHRKVMQYNYNKLYNGSVTSTHSLAHPEKNQPSAEGSQTSISSAISQANNVNNIQSRWCCGEDAELFRERWEKLFKEFCDGDKVDPSKISELYDTMKFDALHNRQFLEWVFTPSKQMLEEEYGVKIDKDGKDGSKDGSVKDGKDGKPTANNPDEVKSGQETRDERRDSDKSSDKNVEVAARGGSSVRRLFRRRSFLNNMRHSEGTDPEQYFRLYKGNAETKAKTDIRFEPLRELYQLAKVLFDFICPQEYGISDSEKLEIGLLTSLPLLKEIVQDLEEMQASNDAKSFFYFTKESHIYTLLNCILEGGIETKIKRSTIPELDYLSQICFELYESETKMPAEAVDRGDEPTFAYSIRITISPGCHVFDPLDVQLDSKHSISCATRRSLTSHADWMEVIRTLRAKFNQVKLPKTFLAINLSDLFSWEELEKSNSDQEVLEMKRMGRGSAELPEGAVNSEEGTVSAGALFGAGVDVSPPTEPTQEQKTQDEVKNDEQEGETKQ